MPSAVAISFTMSGLISSPEVIAPVLSASTVDALKRRIASSTCCSFAVGAKVIFARDSETRMIASSCLTVIGIFEDFPVLAPFCSRVLSLTWTKKSSSFLLAASEILGAHFLCALGL